MKKQNGKFVIIAAFLGFILLFIYINWISNNTMPLDSERKVDEYLSKYREFCDRYGWITVTVYLNEKECEDPDLIIRMPPYWLFSDSDCIKIVKACNESCSVSS